ncbi:hypothetical protein B7R22_05340 [Subtercola boreus]|uniref:Uncharacterized protein n=1 Tax=Subtercola boreus TaxID=120213 RepID=A0A3E0W0K4_9MICO|nr:hypothetical protein [Subtercola boreus]RFA15832.1 hypothetical protein B7R22_05340 [Subtercola boreus]
MTTTEAEWDAEQVGYLIASVERQADLNPFGVPYSLATDPAIRDSIVVDLEVDLMARAVKQRRDSDAKTYEHQDQSGWFYTPRIER